MNLIKRMIRRAALALCLLAGTAQATDAQTDYGELELGKSYDYVLFTEVTGHYTATAKGILTVTSSNTTTPTPYADEAMTERMSYTNLSDDTPNYHLYYNLQVEAGQTVWFAVNSLNAGSFTLTFSDNAELTLSSVSLEEGSTVSCSSDTPLTFRFNHGVTLDGAELTAGEASRSLVANISQNTVTLSLRESLYELLKEGSLEGGDEFSVILKGVRMADDESVVYGTDGTCTATYVSGPRPVALESNTLDGSTFLSYWHEGDSSGIFSLTFDGELQQPASTESSYVLISYGDPESETATKYNEQLPYTVDGRTLTFDLTGRERTPESMTGASTVYDDIYIKVIGVYGADGTPAYTTDAGSSASYSFSMPYVVVTADITTEFTPASGGSLEGCDAIELWVTDYEKLSFDGVRFDYSDGTSAHSLVTTDYTATPDALVEGSYTILIPVPEAVRGMKDIIVTLEGLTAADGHDYSAYFRAKYDGFTVTRARYRLTSDAAQVNLAGASLQSLSQDSQLTLQTNMADEAPYLRASFRNRNATTGTAAMDVATGSWTLDDSGNFTAQVGSELTFLEGYDYCLCVEGYASEADYVQGAAPLGTDSVFFEGESIVEGIHTASASERPAVQGVYTTDGVLRQRDASPAALKQLPKGVYIVNGRKLLVR